MLRAGLLLCHRRGDVRFHHAHREDVRVDHQRVRRRRSAREDGGQAASLLISWLTGHSSRVHSRTCCHHRRRTGTDARHAAGRQQQ